MNNSEYCICINSSPSSDAYMRQWVGPAFVQIVACRLFYVKPLSKPMLGYCQLGPHFVQGRWVKWASIAHITTTELASISLIPKLQELWFADLISTQCILRFLLYLANSRKCQIWIISHTRPISLLTFIFLGALCFVDVISQYGPLPGRK